MALEGGLQRSVDAAAMDAIAADNAQRGTEALDVTMRALDAARQSEMDEEEAMTADIDVDISESPDVPAVDMA